MNVDVKCRRKTCQTTFVTGHDTFLNKGQPQCPKCGESWAVHMIDDEGRPIHPTEVCPTCMAPALLMTRCRCAFYCIKCKNGHDWHTCVVHKKQIVGTGHERPKREDRCTCEAA
jgi:hypothetical protein